MEMYSTASILASPVAPNRPTSSSRYSKVIIGVMIPIRTAAIATDVACSRADRSSSAPRDRATSVPAAIDKPMLIAFVKNNNVPAYPTAAAKASFPSIEMKIMSTKSTAKSVSRPIEVVKDMTATCCMRLPWVNLASAIMYPLRSVQ